MATLTRSTTVSGGTLYHRITYSVTNTDTTTTVTLTKVEARFSNSSSYLPFALSSLTVACDGTTLYTHPRDATIVYTTGTTWWTVATPNKSKSFTRGKTAATKSITLTYTSTSSADITVPAKPSYAVTYNANGGSGAPSAQTKWYGETLTLSTAKPTRTNYVFKNWNTAAAGTGTAYASGASYTANAALTLYAQWYAPYTVAYNANGGTGAPASQVKVYNTALTLSTTVPTRTDFAFLRWNTNSAGSGTSYASGASYTANANATLYAQWQRTYADPKVTIGSVQRVDATEHESDDDGTSVAVTFSWSLFDTPSGTNHPTDVTVTVTDSDGVTKATLSIDTLTGTTGTHTAYLDANCDTNQPYVVTITLTDEGGSSRSATVRSTVPTVYFPIDIRQGGRGVAIGGPAYEDALDIYMPTRIVDRGDGSDQPLRIVNDEAADVLTVDWDGNVVAGGDFRTVDPRLDTTASSLAEYTYRAWSIRDANDRTVMYLQAAESAAGMVLTTIAARRVVSGENADNRLDLRVAADGTRSVVVSDAAAWRTGLGLGLHTSSVTLSGCTASINRCWHNGVVATVSMDSVIANAALSSGSSVVLGTVPSGYRPPDTVHCVVARSSAAQEGKMHVRLTSAGELRLYNYTGSTIAAGGGLGGFTITYCI